jgi:hypothetical protein
VRIVRFALFSALLALSWVLSGVFWPAPARAIKPAEPQEIPCRLAEEGVIVPDGLFEDWRGQTSVTRGNADHGVAIYCNYSAKKLYLGIDVKDERIIRSRKRVASAEDHLVARFGRLALTVFPGYPDANVKGSIAWSDRKPRRHVRVVEALQQRGWGVELAIPLAELPGWSPGTPRVPFAIVIADADMASERRLQGTLSLTRALAFEEADAALRQFLGDFRLTARAIRLDTLANVDGEPGTERMLWGGRVVAMLRDGYTYVEIPAQPRDVLEVRVVDLAGRGKASIVARFRQRGNGGSREVLAVWNFVDGAFRRSFAHEIAKEFGGKRIANQWSLRARKGRRARGLELVIGKATSTFSEAEWNEAPAEDMQPILLPWAEKKEEVWTFDGDQVSGG